MFPPTVRSVCQPHLPECGGLAHRILWLTIVDTVTETDHFDFELWESTDAGRSRHESYTKEVAALGTVLLYCYSEDEAVMNDACSWMVRVVTLIGGVC